MGLKQDALNFVFKCIDAGFKSYQDIQMLELGNQELKLPEHREAAKYYFERLGFKHTSFDINGRDGALPIDLSKIIENKEYYNKFDIVTNSGTSEHVEPYEGQYECFRNIHLCTNVGGMMIHIVPEDGSFRNHCPYYYTIEFFEKLAKYNKYEIMEISRLHRGKNVLITAGLIKNEDVLFCNNKDELLGNIIQRPCDRKGHKRTRINLKMEKLKKKILHLNILQR